MVIGLVGLQDHSRFHIEQSPTLMYKRFRIFSDDGQGERGELVAFVQQDKGSFKERVMVYADEEKKAPLVEYAARSVLDGMDLVDVRTPEADPLGVLRKSIGKSLYHSTWTAEPDGGSPLTVTEVSKAVALTRRGWRFLPFLGEFPFPVRHAYDFLRDGRRLGGLRKTARLDDQFLLELDDEQLDRRFALAVGLVISPG